MVTDRVVCVLGCRVGSPAFLRRAAVAAAILRDGRASLAVTCGGRAWNGRVEADALADFLKSDGVAPDAIVRERLSLDTHDNARFAASLLRRRGITAVYVVTCTWHLPRATRLFRAAGLDVEGIGVEPPHPTNAQRVYWWMRERVTSWKDARRPMRIP